MLELIVTIFKDHIYSDKHKKSLKNVQVIAGFEERLFMNRPVVQEYIDADEFRKGFKK